MKKPGIQKSWGKLSLAAEDGDRACPLSQCSLPPPASLLCDAGQSWEGEGEGRGRGGNVFSSSIGNNNTGGPWLCWKRGSARGLEKVPRRKCFWHDHSGGQKGAGSGIDRRHGQAWHRTVPPHSELQRGEATCGELHSPLRNPTQALSHCVSLPFLTLELTHLSPSLSFVPNLLVTTGM